MAVQPALTGRIRLGIPGEYAPTVLPRILGRFTQQNPGIKLEINCDLSGNLLAEDSGAYDLILALEVPGVRKRGKQVRRDDLVWVGGKQSTITAEGVVKLVVAKSPCLYRERALRSLDAVGVPWEIAYTSSDLAGMTAALQEGLGVTAMARQTVPESLYVLQNSSRLPALGQMGVYLIRDKHKRNAALDRLVESVRNSLL